MTCLGHPIYQHFYMQELLSLQLFCLLLPYPSNIFQLYCIAHTSCSWCYLVKTCSYHPKKVILISFHTWQPAWLFGQFFYSEQKMSFQHWFIPAKIIYVRKCIPESAPSTIPFSSWEIIYSLYTDSLLTRGDMMQVNDLELIMLVLCIGGSTVCSRI